MVDPKEKVSWLIRDITEYDTIINEIGDILHKYGLNFVEAFGILECVKQELISQEEQE